MPGDQRMFFRRVKGASAGGGRYLRSGIGNSSHSDESKNIVFSQKRSNWGFLSKKSMLHNLYKVGSHILASPSNSSQGYPFFSA